MDQLDNLPLKEKNELEDPGLNPTTSLPTLKSVEYVSRLDLVDKHFQVIDKCGEGAFSAVFQVQLRHASSLLKKKRYALKLLVPTGDPGRVRNEILALCAAGGSQNVVTLHTALREKDHVMLLMPFMPHTPFAEYYDQLCIDELRNYMYNLLLALRHIHRLGLIHRDVKPSNFLYDRKLRRFALVDFGLAHAQDAATERRLYATVGAACPPEHLLAGAADLSPLAAKRRRLPTNGESGNQSETILRRCLSSSSRLNEVAAEEASSPAPLACRCGPSASPSPSVSICRPCMRLPRATAKRGGTNSYRPPEVLLRVTAQATGVDVWAAGMIMAALVSGRAPFLRCDDDFDCLRGLAALCGRPRLCRTARRLGKRLQLDGAAAGDDADDEEENAAGYCRRLQRACGAAGKWPVAAYQLLALLLEPDPGLRVTAAGALKHAFFAERRVGAKRLAPPAQ